MAGGINDECVHEMEDAMIFLQLYYNEIACLEMSD
jgi:hypothetical protein